MTHSRTCSLGERSKFPIAVEFLIPLFDLYWLKSDHNSIWKHLDEHSDANSSSHHANICVNATETILMRKTFGIQCTIPSRTSAIFPAYWCHAACLSASVSTSWSWRDFLCLTWIFYGWEAFALESERSEAQHMSSAEPLRPLNAYNYTFRQSHTNAHPHTHTYHKMHFKHRVNERSRVHPEYISEYISREKDESERQKKKKKNHES